MKISKLLLILIILFSCKEQKQNEVPKEKYLRWVGDIIHNPKFDDESFELCNGDENIKQYFNNSGGLEYEGEKFTILETFKNDFMPNPALKDTGLLRVRFIVNCKGETGRFRMIGMNDNYEEKEFDSSIEDQILNIIKSLNGWKPKIYQGVNVDYYQYLILKFRNGKIIEILP